MARVAESGREWECVCVCVSGMDVHLLTPLSVVYIAQVWTAEGRRALSPIQLPAPAAFLAAAAPHQLLVVSSSGQLMQWHMRRHVCVLQESVQPVLAAAAAANTTVRQIRLSKAGLPLAVLGNRTTLGFDPSLRCWLRLADDAFVGSAFASVYTLGAAGPGAELAAMQVCTARGYRGRSCFGFAAAPSS
jgi:protein HIRA/HIR1